MAAPDATRQGLEQVWAIWRRRWWLALSLFASPFVLAGSIAAFLPDIYEATARVLVEHQQVPETFVQSTVTGALETRLQTISQEILSRSRIEGLIARFDLYPELRAAGQTATAVARTRDDIEVRLEGVRQGGRGESTVAFTVGYRGREAALVAQVANTLASFYIEENLRIRERLATGTAEFLRTQLDETRQRLDEQEGRVSEFKRRHLGELPEQMAANLATLEGLSAQLRVNSDSQTRALERRGALVQQASGGSTVGSPVAGPDPIEVRLMRLRRELDTLRTLFTEKYPDVVRVKSEIALLERQLATGSAEAVAVDGTGATDGTGHGLRLKQALAEADGEINALKAEERRLRSAIARYQERVENTPRREQEFQELARNYQSTKELYARLLKRYEEAQLAETLEQRQKGEQFRILDPAIPPLEPVAPRRFRLAILSLIASLGLGAAAALVAERLDGAFHTIDDLRTAVAVPVVGRISHIVSAREIRRRRRRAWLGVGVGLVGLAGLVGVSYLVADGNERLVRLLIGRF